MRIHLLVLASSWPSGVFPFVHFLFLGTGLLQGSHEPELHGFLASSTGLPSLSRVSVAEASASFSVHLSSASVKELITCDCSWNCSCRESPRVWMYVSNARYCRLAALTFCNSRRAKVCAFTALCSARECSWALSASCVPSRACTATGRSSRVDCRDAIKALSLDWASVVYNSLL